MPRVARFKIGAIGELYRQLRYAPPEARRRQMEAAEQLTAEIDPQRVYPEEFIIFRITGYRPDRADEPVALVGEALVGDLATLIQRLSNSLNLSSNDDGRTAIPLEQLARRLNVSAKTLQRYRRRGLICHYVVLPDGTKRLVCFEESLRRFATGHRGQIAEAAAFSRVDEAVRQKIIREAGQLRRSLGLSLNDAALRLAGKHHRAHETVRMILRRHDRRAAEPVFCEPGPLTERDVRLIYRAVRMGVSSAELSRRFGKTRPTIHRAVNRRRGELLRELDFQFDALPTPIPSGDRDDTEPAILSAPAVTTGLADLLPHDDALALIEAVHQADTPDEDVEQALLGGYTLLKRRARDAINALGEYPASHVLDRIETDLRWATLLKRRLVALGLPAAVCSVEEALHRPLAHQPSEEILTLLRLAIEVVAGTVETIDPSRGSRLPHVCGFAMNRALAASRHRPRIGRAATRHQPGSVPMANPFGSLNPWQQWLQLRPDLQRLVGRLEPPLRRLIALRYGLSGKPPLTAAQLAEQSGVAVGAMTRLLARAEGQLRTQVRASRG